MRTLPIREVAAQTGLAAGTIRMWEQRYGFPSPQRTPSGYRLYSPEDVETLRRVVALRQSGLSVPAALSRARAAVTGATDRPSIFGAVPHRGRARPVRKRTLVALSRAIEEETLACGAGPVVLAAFQRSRHYRAVEHRYRRMAAVADVIAVFADFGAGHRSARVDGAPVEVGVPADAPIGHEWAVVVDAPGFSVCLVGWEPPVREPPARDVDRVFEAFLTLDPEAVRAAAQAGAAIARTDAPDVADRIERLLADRPLHAQPSSAALESLAMRLVCALDRA